MPDANWKALERRFGKVWAEILGVEDFRRNKAQEHADNPDLNSDVDIEHEKLELIDDEGAVIRKGITGECRYISGTNLAWIPRALKEATKQCKTTTPIVVVNNRWLCHWLRHGLHVYEAFVVPFSSSLVDTMTTPAEIAERYTIHHVTVKTVPQLLAEKTAQAWRYAENKKLVPALCLGFKGQQPIEVFDLTFDPFQD